MSEIDPGQDGQVDFARFHRFLLALTSFNKTSRHGAFQAAYRTPTRAMHEALELPISTGSLVARLSLIQFPFWNVILAWRGWMDGWSRVT